MPSTYSPSLRIELIGAGEQSGTWGTTTNTNLGTLLEQSIAGVQAITMFDANYTLTNYNGVSDEARKAVLVVGGTNGAVRDIIAPLVTKSYTIRNNTTGGFDINIRAATGASVSIPNGGTSAVYCDGTNFNLALTQTIVAAGTAISVATVGATTTVTNTGVASFNTRTGAVTQTSADVTTALGYTPPTPTGTGASGTWGINVTGNADTASNLNGTWDQMPAGTRVPFAQAAAPTGWTQDTSDNATNRMLRVVNTAGNGVGGSASPILNNVVSSHTHTFTGSTLGNHTHTDSGHNHAASTNAWAPGGGAVSGNAYSFGSVASVTVTSSTANLSSNSAGTPAGTNAANASASDWEPRYIDMIICAKN